LGVVVVLRLFIIITYRCRFINIFKQNDDDEDDCQQAEARLCMELNNCCVRLCRANILQIKRFSDFVNVGYQFPLAHTHTNTHFGMSTY